MDPRVTCYTPCTCMVTVNFHFNEYPRHEELAALYHFIRVWFSENRGGKIKLNDLLMYLRGEKPILQVFFAYSRRDDAFLDGFIRTVTDFVDDCFGLRRPTNCTVTEIRVRTMPGEY